MSEKELNFVPISLYLILFSIGTVGNLLIVGNDDGDDDEGGGHDDDGDED